MQSQKADIAGQTAIILGAGASRGEYFAGGQANPHILPPLDSDFFAQVQRVGPQDVSTRLLLKIARQLFGPVPSCTMEEFFTTVEFLAEFSGIGRLERDEVNPLKWDVAKIAFKESLLRVLTDAGIGTRDGPAQPPTYHGQLLGVLSPGDTVISFNYDVLADCALGQRWPRRWSPGPEWNAEIAGEWLYWNACNGTSEASTHEILLLKMHGSVNWEIHDDRIALTKPEFDPNEMAVIPPAWNKDIKGSRVFTKIWQNAVQLLQSASVLMIVGYALPRTDMWAQTLLRYSSTVRAAEDRPFEHVLVANPDNHAVDRLVGLIGSAIGHETRVMRFEGLRELVGFLA